jgi:hypothetical protein
MQLPKEQNVVTFSIQLILICESNIKLIKLKTQKK